MSGAEPSLVDKVILLDESLSAHGIGHAFGDALAYYTLGPRATADIDVNVSADVLVGLVGDDERLDRLRALA